jgi:putative ABC transport system permease protein
LPNLGRDFRYGWRRLRATPAFTVFAIVTLALGIGVTTGIYSAVRAVMSPLAVGVSAGSW